MNKHEMNRSTKMPQTPITIILFSMPESLAMIKKSMDVRDGLKQIGIAGEKVTIPANQISKNKKTISKDREITVPEGQVAISLRFQNQEMHDTFWENYVKLEEEAFKNRNKTS